MKAFASELYTGKNRIIIAIDIGTSHTGVSYAYLYPKYVNFWFSCDIVLIAVLDHMCSGPQAVTRVGEWPGQPAHRGESKIPTVIWYDRQNKVCPSSRRLGRIGD